MSTQYVIRDAKKEESEFLSDFTVRSKSHWGYPEDYLERCRPHLIVSEDYITNWPVRVLEFEGEIAGYMSLKNITGENRLDNLWIEPKFIKHGFGTVLFEEAVNQAKKLGWNSFRLATEEHAIGFYEKLGAKIIGQIQSRLGKEIFLIHVEYIIE